MNVKLLEYEFSQMHMPIQIYILNLNISIIVAVSWEVLGGKVYRSWFAFVTIFATNSHTDVGPQFLCNRINFVSFLHDVYI